jgi:hypothetical protein
MKIRLNGKSGGLGFGLVMAAAAVAAPAASAAITTTTSGVYDDTVRTNAVDQSATTPTLGNVVLVPLSQFKTDVAAAYVAGTGGVINFDDVTTGTSSQSDIFAKYGPGNSRTLTLTNPNYNPSPTAGAGYQVDMSSSTAIGATPISGNFYLRSNGTTTHAFNFSSPIGEVGFTVLSRSADRTVTATVTYDDGSNGSVGPFTVKAGDGTFDTFFGFAAPVGRTIKSLQVGPGNTTDFVVLDDVAFVTVPEPGTVAIGVVGALGLLGRRRRGR